MACAAHNPCSAILPLISAVSLMSFSLYVLTIYAAQYPFLALPHWLNIPLFFVCIHNIFSLVYFYLEYHHMSDRCQLSSVALVVYRLNTLRSGLGQFARSNLARGYLS